MNSKEHILQRVNSLNWVHSIDLGHGIVTPGRWGSHNPAIWKALDEIHFQNKKVLDIGCWDGLWSFECEKRGASEVYATDYNSQRDNTEMKTFELAHEVLRSKVRYYPDIPVFDIKEKLRVSNFDVVLFCGIYYHLKNPLLALARLRSVMKTGGTIIIEGDVLNGYKEVFARFYYHDIIQDDPSNWWVPTIPCLREWVECSFFQIVKETNSYAPPKESLSGVKKFVKAVLGREETHVRSKYTIIARAICRKDPMYAFPDDDLKDFNVEV